LGHLRLLSPGHGEKGAIERVDEARGIGGSSGLGFSATNAATRHAGRVSEPELFVRLGGGSDKFRP
jgi:hypothetical protein